MIFKKKKEEKVEKVEIGEESKSEFVTKEFLINGTWHRGNFKLVTYQSKYFGFWISTNSGDWEIWESEMGNYVVSLYHENKVLVDIHVKNKDDILNIAEMNNDKNLIRELVRLLNMEDEFYTEL